VCTHDTTTCKHSTSLSQRRISNIWKDLIFTKSPNVVWRGKCLYYLIHTLNNWQMRIWQGQRGWGWKRKISSNDEEADASELVI
jgi:hypothetical protein